MENFLKGEKQMNALACASTDNKIDWKQIFWDKHLNIVRKLQMRIVKAQKEGRYNKVKALQWILTHSFSVKLIAVKRVTENKGKKTPGIDNVIWKSSEDKINAAKDLKRQGYKAKPLRRVFIPKKNGNKRPLGIPTVTSYCTPPNFDFELRYFDIKITA
jgi:RNA-directed DNA polymerase